MNIDKHLSGIENLVYQTIKELILSNSGSLKITQEEISTKTGVSLDYTRKCISHLIELKKIICKISEDGDRIYSLPEIKQPKIKPKPKIKPGPKIITPAKKESGMKHEETFLALIIFSNIILILFIIIYLFTL